LPPAAVLLVEGLVDERSLHMTEKPEVWWCKIRTVRWVRHTPNMVFSDKLLSDLWKVEDEYVKFSPAEKFSQPSVPEHNSRRTQN
jgi:hypothetical protein